MKPSMKDSTCHPGPPYWAHKLITIINLNPGCPCVHEAALGHRLDYGSLLSFFSWSVLNMVSSTWIAWFTYGKDTCIMSGAVTVMDFTPALVDFIWWVTLWHLAFRGKHKWWVWRSICTHQVDLWHPDDQMHAECASTNRFGDEAARMCWKNGEDLKCAVENMEAVAGECLKVHWCYKTEYSLLSAWPMVSTWHVNLHCSTKW